MGRAEMKRLAVAIAILFVAVLLQLTVLNGLPLPGGGAPDLVLLCVVAIGLAGGVRAGLIAGFCAGLALDLAPPAVGLVGEYALVFTLAGYFSGRMRPALLRSALLGVAAGAVAVVGAEVATAILAVALGRPPATVGEVARVLPASVLYDLIVLPVALFVAVRLAGALGVSFSTIADSPVFESGGSAAPPGLAGLGRPGAPQPARLAWRGVGTDSWLSGDLAGVAPAVGAVGWLSGPANSRRARRERARLAAALAGAMGSNKEGWVGYRLGGPAGGYPAYRPGPPQQVRLRSWAGVPGSASALARPGPAAAGREVRLGLAGEQRRRRRSVAAAGRRQRRAPVYLLGVRLPGPRRGGTVRSPVGRSGAEWHGAGAHGVNGPELPRISFGTGLVAPGTPVWRPGVPRISFGAGGLPGPARPAGAGVPRIAFGAGSLPGASRPGQYRPAQPNFRSARGRTGPSRSAAGAWLAGGRSPVRHPKQPRFSRSVPTFGGYPVSKSRPGKAPRLRPGPRRVPWLPWVRRAGGRSTVWRIGAGRLPGGYR
jgi:rod shape-determining protein MreD